MNRICRQIIDKPLRFSIIRPLDKIDYRLFTNSDNIIKDVKINELYNELNLETSRLLEKENIAEQTKIYIRERFNELGYAEKDIINSLAYYLYHKPTIRKKRMLWLVYGETLFNNLNANINRDTEYCLRCGRRVKVGELNKCKCEHCMKKEKRMSKVLKIKHIQCEDCGCDVEVGLFNTKTSRCSDCGKKRDLQIRRERKRRES